MTGNPGSRRGDEHSHGRDCPIKPAVRYPNPSRDGATGAVTGCPDLLRHKRDSPPAATARARTAMAEGSPPALDGDPPALPATPGGLVPSVPMHPKPANRRPRARPPGGSQTKHDAPGVSPDVDHLPALSTIRQFPVDKGLISDEYRLFARNTHGRIERPAGAPATEERTKGNADGQRRQGREARGPPRPYRRQPAGYQGSPQTQYEDRRSGGEPLREPVRPHAPNMPGMVGEQSASVGQRA